MNKRFEIPKWKIREGIHKRGIEYLKPKTDHGETATANTNLMQKLRL